jgi:hypothetical protein
MRNQYNLLLDQEHNSVQQLTLQRWLAVQAASAAAIVAYFGVPGRLAYGISDSPSTRYAGQGAAVVTAAVAATTTTTSISRKRPMFDVERDVETQVASMICHHFATVRSMPVPSGKAVYTLRASVLTS